MFTDYHAARAAAQVKADATGLDVAIRACREYGRKVFNVSFACRNDSGYNRAEIVRPARGRA